MNGFMFIDYGAEALFPFKCFVIRCLKATAMLRARDAQARGLSYFVQSQKATAMIRARDAQARGLSYFAQSLKATAI